MFGKNDKKNSQNIAIEKKSIKKLENNFRCTNTIMLNFRVKIGKERKRKNEGGENLKKQTENCKNTWMKINVNCTI